MGPEGRRAAYLDVGMALVAGAELATAALFLAVLVELGSAQDGDALSLVRQRERRRSLQTLLVSGVHGEDDGNGLVGHALVK